MLLRQVVEVKRHEHPLPRDSLGRPAASALRVHEHVKERLLGTVAGSMSRRLGVSTPTVAKSLRHLESLGVVKETTGRRRGRVFVYDAYLKVLAQGTEPL